MAGQRPGERAMSRRVRRPRLQNLSRQKAAVRPLLLIETTAAAGGSLHALQAHIAYTYRVNDLGEECSWWGFK